MSGLYHLAVDMMSGDHGLRTTFPAAAAALHQHTDTHLHLVGDAAAIAPLLPQLIADQHRVTVHDAATVLPMHASAADALRRGTGSSLNVGLDRVACGEAGALVTAANTTGLIALGRRALRRTAAIDRPALCSAINTPQGTSFMLDLGANIDCSASHLLDFAHLGAALVRLLYPEREASVALLSNGVEPGKGNALVRAAARLLQDDPGIDYRGYVEAHELHAGRAAVVVCDGFVGNVALKAMEGTARYAVARLREADQAPSPMLLSALDADRRNGALLLGLDGLLVKAHGDSSSAGLTAAIDFALSCVRSDVAKGVAAQLGGIRTTHQESERTVL